MLCNKSKIAVLFTAIATGIMGGTIGYNLKPDGIHLTDKEKKIASDMFGTSYQKTEYRNDLKADVALTYGQLIDAAKSSFECIKIPKNRAAEKEACAVAMLNADWDATLSLKAKIMGYPTLWTNGVPNYR